MIKYVCLLLFQEVSLGLLRGDYLLDYPDKTTIKQVEINTISVSFAGGCTQLTRLHRYGFFFSIVKIFWPAKLFQFANVKMHRCMFGMQFLVEGS